MLLRVLVLQKSLLRFVLGTFTVVTLLLTPVQMTFALGVGSVKTESYIGEPFSAWVPLLNVVNAEQLLVEVSPSSIVPDANVGTLQSQLVELDNQLNVRITSDQPVNEPYLIFSLQLTEAGQVVTRDFTVLLEIQPQQGEFANTVGSSSEFRSDIATPLNNSQANSGAIVYVDTPEILGPYDYAVKGRVPQRFGAVLDGQSLWRVARRINQALDVSINQMMWALYVHNPDAFATESVDSLRAGQYLTIPTFTEVARVNDAQALSNLDRLSFGQYVSNVEVPAGIEAVQSDDSGIDIPPTQIVDEAITTTDRVAIEPDDAVASDSVEDSFKLSGLEDLASSNSVEGDEQSLEVINSLAVTVGNLTQELISKDKQIEFLEDKIIALESIAALDANTSGNQRAGIDTTLANNTNQISNSLTADSESSLFKPWLIWLLLFSLALLTMLLLRKRFSNVFSRHEDIEFTQKTNIESVKNRQSDHIDALDKNYSNLAVVKKSEDDAVDGFSYISVNDTQSLDVSETDELSESFITVDEEDFDGYLASLIESRRFDSALNFLESQRRNMIDEDRYHVERLGVYFEQRDQDAFYAYYDEIETIMQRFGDAANRRISEMVVALEEQMQKEV